MDQVERKKALVEKLAISHKALDFARLYTLPRHRESKNWLAEVAAILRNLDETDYQTFINLKKKLDTHVLRSSRMHVVEEIDNFMREKVAAYKLYNFEPQGQPFPRQRAALGPTAPYVATAIITGFTKKKDKFNYKKLIKLLKELNSNHAKGQQYSSAMLIRAVLDHIPPLLGFITFKQVAKTYPWNKTDMKFMKSLLEFKDNADATLHRKISEDEDIYEIQDLPYSNRFNRLLQECLKGGGGAEFIKAKQLGSTKEIEPSSKIEISLVEDRCGSWQHYAIGRYVGYSFKFVLDVDNFKSSKLDYVSAYLKANSNNGPWEAKYFVFETDGTDLNKPFEIEAGKQKLVTVVISDQEFTHGSHEHRFKPNVNMETLALCVTTKSGRFFEFPIKEAALK
jgi:hypothetical protein